MGFIGVKKAKLDKSTIKNNTSHDSQLPLQNSFTPLTDSNNSSNSNFSVKPANSQTANQKINANESRKLLGHKNFSVPFTKGARVYSQTMHDQTKIRQYSTNQQIEYHIFVRSARDSRNWFSRPYRSSISTDWLRN